LGEKDINLTTKDLNVSMSPLYSRESANTLFNFMRKFEFLEAAVENLELFPRYNSEDVKYLHLKAESKDISAILLLK